MLCRSGRACRIYRYIVYGVSMRCKRLQGTYPNWFGITGYPPARSPAAKGNPAVGRPTERKKKRKEVLNYTFLKEFFFVGCCGCLVCFEVVILGKGAKGAQGVCAFGFDAANDAVFCIRRGAIFWCITRVLR